MSGAPACVGKPAAWWVPETRTDPCIGLALAYCSMCPVKAWCEETATADDRMWSIRAGRLPEWMQRRNP